MNRPLKFKFIGITLVLMAISLFTWALQNRYLRAKMVVAQIDTIHKTFVYDKTLLSKFEQVTKKYDSLGRANFTMAGVINVIDRADTSFKLSNVSFLICKSGKEFYYKLGTTETINAGGVCLYVDNDSKKITVGPQAAIQYETSPVQFTGLTDKLRGDEYNMTGKVTGGTQTITFLNDTHISCKQYTLSYDTLSKELKHMYIRLTNIEAPLRRDNEKTIDIKVFEFDDKSDLKKYHTYNDVLKKDAGQWKTQDRFKNYELTINN